MSLLSDKNFQTRAITGALFVGVVVAGIYTHYYAFLGLLFIINLFCLVEFYRLTIDKDQILFVGYSVFTAILFSTVMAVAPAFSVFDNTVQKLFLVLACAIFFQMFIQLYYKSEKPFANLGFSFLGIVYISIPIILLLANSRNFSDDYNPSFVLLLFMLVWINDTGAYLAGNFLGKTKLFERISPKKTWEGFIGGLVLCMLVAAPFGRFVLHQSPWLFCGLGLTIGIFSTLGDLIESQLKRSLQIKDSGNFLPGHGGFLDRFDGFLMAMPAAFFYMAIFAW